MLGGKVICQKDAFLCAAKGVFVGIEFQRKLGTGFFGGEGFIMQKIEGDGLAFCAFRGLGQPARWKITEVRDVRGLLREKGG